jgi:hypothetical protein
VVAEKTLGSWLAQGLQGCSGGAHDLETRPHHYSICQSLLTLPGELAPIKLVPFSSHS